MTSWAINIISTLFHLLFFATPLILWPGTSEVFEFNKLVFVYLIAIAILTTWAVDTIVSKRFTLARTPLNLPIALFVLVQIITTLTSIHPHTSIFGYYSRFHGGLLSTLSYSLLYYAFVTYIPKSRSTTQTYLITLSTSLTLVAIYAIAERFGIDKHIWVQDVQNRVFSTLGQPNWLAAYLIALIPISLTLGAHHLAQKNRNLGLYLIGNAVIALISIIFTKSQSGLGATIIILPLTLIYLIRTYNLTHLYRIIIPIVLVLALLGRERLIQSYTSLLKIVPFYSTSSELIEEENQTRIGGSDSMVIRRLVWTGAIDIFRQYPILGTGPETFAYAYYTVRPATHNLVSEWDFIYNKAHNEYLNFLATTGIFGLVTYLSIIYISLRTFWTSRTNHKYPHISAGLLLGYLSILITNFFGFSVVTIALFFFLLPALAIAQTTPDYHSRHINLGFYIPLFFVGWLSLNLFSSTLRYWQADRLYASGRNAIAFGPSYLAHALDQLSLAHSLKPGESTYLAPLAEAQAQASLSLATQLADPEATPAADVAQKIISASSQYWALAEENVAKLIELHPYHVNNYKNKAKVHLILASTSTYLISDPIEAKKANDQQYALAIKSMTDLVRLAPTDARSHYNLGLIYLNAGDTESAIQYLELAYKLKPDYIEAKDQLNLLLGQ
jgi:putative inorganic carbon (hco3(-)) transporter